MKRLPHHETNLTSPGRRCNRGNYGYGAAIFLTHAGVAPDSGAPTRRPAEPEFYEKAAGGQIIFR